MTTHISTTPFGRRPLTLGQVASNAAARARPLDKAVHKGKVFRAICAAKASFGIGERALSVLDALLSFHPETILVGDGLIVFPSNRQLSLRAHGMAPATLRRHLGALVAAGLILRRDSPNGKRYARKGSDGEVELAFGFDLGPLVARADEIEACAERVRVEERELRNVRERITICRREVVKGVEACAAENVPGPGGKGGSAWAGVLAEYRQLVANIPRSGSRAELEPIASRLAGLADFVLNQLEIHSESQVKSANESQSERHIQNSNPNHLIAFEPSLRQRLEGKEIPISSRTMQPRGSYPLGLVLTACPDIVDYCRGGIASWRDLLAAAATVRPMLGISPSAWEAAEEAMGEADAAIVVAAILQKGAAVSSAGGYLRDLTRRAAEATFSPGPMLMALVSARNRTVRRP